MGINNKKLEETFEVCLKELFLRVGLDYKDKDSITKQDEWYSLYTWSKSEQDSFEKWMIEFLRKKMRWNKKTALKETGFFMLNYGWKVENLPTIGCIKK